MPIRAVVFDLDNTLILEDTSTFDAVDAAAALAARRTGVDAETVAKAAVASAEALWRSSPVAAAGDAFGIWWGEGLWGDFAGDGATARALRAFVPGFRVAVWRDALARAGVPDGALAAELSREYVRARRGAETIDPDAEPLLASLAGRYALALVTNGAGDVQREKLSRTPFAPSFAVILTSLEAGVGKPDPRIFAIALERLGVAAADAVYVGDSLLRDVAGSHAAGMRAVWIDRKLWQEPDGIRPDARIERLSDLPAALAALERPSASPPASA